MRGMGGQILPRGYLGITLSFAVCIHGLGGMDSTMEHACATSHADKKPDVSENQVLNSSRLSIGQMAWPLDTLVSSSKIHQNFRKIAEIEGKKTESSRRHLGDVNQ